MDIVDCGLAAAEGRQDESAEIMAPTATGPGEHPPTADGRAAASPDLTALCDQWDTGAHAIPRPLVAPDDGKEAVDAVEDDPRDAEQIQRPDVPEDEAEPPYGQRQGRPSDREMMKLAFERRAERDAERKQASDERLNTVLTKPTRRDSAPVSDVQSSCQPQITVEDEGSTLPSEITSVIQPTDVGDEGDGHETNDGDPASPSTQGGTAAADDAIPETAAGYDATAVERDGHELCTAAMTSLEMGDRPSGMTAAVIDEVEPAASSTDASQAVTAAADESMADENQHVPLSKSKQLDQPPDDSTGDLDAVSNSDNKIDDRRFRRYWYGHRSADSLAAIRTTLLASGKYVAHVDDENNLLSDPEVYRIARDLGVQITRRVHLGWTHSEKLMFIFRDQATGRILTTEDHRMLRNERIKVMLCLGMGYEMISQCSGVCENTVRNVETALAADTNSKSGIRKKRDGRKTWSTPEKIAEAHRLRAEKKNNAEIARALGTTSATISKLFKAHDSKARETEKQKHGEKQTASRNTAPMPLPPEMTRKATHTTGPIGDVPRLVRRVLKHLRLDREAYDELRERCQAKAREAVEAVSGDVNELLDLYLYGSSLAVAAHAQCEDFLDSRGKGRDADPDSSHSAESEHEVGHAVEDIDPDGPTTRSPDDDREIDESGNTPTSLAKPEEGGEGRASGTAHESTRGLVRHQTPGQTLATLDACATAMSPNLDDRMSPHVALADRKAGPQTKEVSR